MSDFDYDHLMHELEDLEEAFPDLRTPDSPTQKVGSDLERGFAQYPHMYPMLSLGNTYNIGEIEDFVKRAEKELGEVGFTYSMRAEIRRHGHLPDLQERKAVQGT